MDAESRYESAEEVQFSLESLPNLIEKVIHEQHQDLLMQLDSRLESFGRRMEREKSFSAVRSGSKLSRLQSHSSKLSRTFTKEDALQIASSSPNLSQRKIGFELLEVDDNTALDSGGSVPVIRKKSDPTSETSELGMPESISLQPKPKMQRTLSAKSAESMRKIDSEDGLNSYDLAHRQGSRVDYFKKQMMMSSSEVVGSGSLDESTYCSGFRKRCAMVVKSNSCELFFALMIVSNSVYLGVQLEIASTNPHKIENQQETFFAVNMVYAVVFLLEVLLRLVASGVRRYFCASGWGWNWLDVFVVSSTWIELLFSLFELEGAEGLSNSNLRLFRIVKITRLARVLRVLRVVQYVRPLRTLMHCLVDTTKSFVWAMLLLVLMMYVFGLLFTDACLDYLRELGNPSDPLSPQKHFGSVSASMGTLFRSISNGLDWSEAVDTLLPVGDIWIWLFYLYIAFISFAVLNVMTGVFCHSAIKAAERDHEMVIHSLLQTKKDFKELVSNLFFRIDDLGLGMITISEFEKHFNDEAVRAFFESLEMGAADAWTLFASLDADGDNVISLKDFTERCIQLHGPARSVDLFALGQQNAKLRDQLKHIEEMQYSLERYVKRKAQDALQTVMDSQDHGTHCLV